jgi:hypothetical protein
VTPRTDRYSRLAWLKTCPGAYALYDQAVHSGVFLVGTVTHAAIDEYTRRCLEAGTGMDLDLAERIARAHAEAVPLADRDSVAAMVGWVAARWDLGKTPGWTTSSEQRLQVLVAAEDNGAVAVSTDPRELRDAPGTKYVLRGTADRVRFNKNSGTVEIWDWKTDRTLAPRSYLHRDLQARIYALLAAETYEADHVIVHWEYVRFQQSDTYELDGPALDAAALELGTLLREGDAAIAALAEYDTKRREDLFRPGSACASCPVFHKCRLAAEVVASFRAGGRIATPDAYVLLKRALAEYEDALKERIHDQGPVRLASGDLIDLIPSERRSLPDNEATIKALRSIHPFSDAALLEGVAKFSVDDAASRAAKVSGLKKKVVEQTLDMVATRTTVLSLRVVPPGTMAPKE